MANDIIFLNLTELFNHSASTYLELATFSADMSRGTRRSFKKWPMRTEHITAVKIYSCCGIEEG